MEREVGRGIGMGNTCKPTAVSFQCMTKSTTIKKKKENVKLVKIESTVSLLGRKIRDSIQILCCLSRNLNIYDLGICDGMQEVKKNDTGSWSSN